MQGLDAEEYDRTYGDLTLLRRIANYFRPHLRTMLIVSGSVVVYSLMQAAQPVLIAYGIDQLRESPSTGFIILLTAVITLMGGLIWVMNFFRQRFAARAVGDVVLALRNDAFNAVMKHDISFYDSYASGKIVSRVTSDTEDFSKVVTLTTDVLSQGLIGIIVIGVLWSIDPILTLITLTIAPLFVAAALAFRRIARSTSQKARRVTAEVNSNIQESVSGISVAKSFRQEDAIYRKFNDTNNLSYSVRLRQGLVFNSIFPLLDLIAGLGTAAVIYFGGLNVLGGTISAGDWFIFVRSLMIFYIPLIHVASFWSQFQQGLAASERIFALIDAEPNVIQTDSQPITTFDGWISFRSVDFHYKPDTPVLKDFSLEIPAGQRVAIVGHTGAGKSSLIRLISRFYEFQGGLIVVDGRDIRRIDLKDYRKHIGVVPQVPFLFSDTVAENIRYGRPEATQEEIEAAARSIGGGEWIQDLPLGLETQVGERGGRLSLGQRQLVALARVLLQNPSIFMLDEATASIDPFTEAQIQEGLNTVMQCRTSIIIAHRLSTVRSADRIIVLDHGAILEEGTHDELMLRGGHYADLYDTYFRHQSLEYVEVVGTY
jgi:ABC-type multidrug transport system fused ATPase/permease subunit